ncbi:diguanylate cyclase [Shewanella sp. 1CM18E]|uniref:diguanylate cyclase n=1 Tax=Shewanella sp. 1CM18E TaxID=2929169 RepID=UPI0020BE2A7B|nr:diguanylate cyclase [Shewanella sp. 1CM18E]MCK8047393.1 diguanylate cyclase [Shewanella sp. 1CM18E]
MDTSQLLINFLLFMLLPIWGIAGLADWFCHRATKIEHTSGVKETLMHSVMGIQIAIPLVLCLLYTVNVLILIICLFTWVLHEVVAHADVRYAAPKREISIWEMHAHNYLGTLPMYMLITIIIINWPQFINLISLNWQGNMSLVPVETPHGGSAYFVSYLSFMAVVCVFPYIEENIRCIRVAMKKRAVN